MEQHVAVPQISFFLLHEKKFKEIYYVLFKILKTPENSLKILKLLYFALKYYYLILTELKNTFS